MTNELSNKGIFLLPSATLLLVGLKKHDG